MVISKLNWSMCLRSSITKRWKQEHLLAKVSIFAGGESWNPLYIAKYKSDICLKIPIGIMLNTCTLCWPYLLLNIFMEMLVSMT